MAFRRSRCAAALAAPLLLAPAPAVALEIVGNFLGGDAPAPALLAGGGDLDTIFEAAASVWESVILDDHTLEVNYRWFPFTDDTLGNAFTQAGSDGRPELSLIALDDDSPWFLDPTPRESSEWGAYEEILFDLGTGEMVVGRDHVDPLGDAALGWDLFTVLLHELGHALGMGVELVAYLDETVDGDVDVAPPLPFPGTELLVTTSGGAHLLLTTALMFPSVDRMARTLPSDADVLAVAQSGGFREVRLVPEPPLALLAASLGAALARRRRGAAHESMRASLRDATHRRTSGVMLCRDDHRP